jgi:hypothetical protein
MNGPKHVTERPTVGERLRKTAPEWQPQDERRRIESRGEDARYVITNLTWAF